MGGRPDADERLEDVLLDEEVVVSDSASISDLLSDASEGLGGSSLRCALGVAGIDVSPISWISLLDASCGPLLLKPSPLVLLRCCEECTATWC